MRRSLGPDAYINEEPPHKAVKLGQAIGTIMTKPKPDDPPKTMLENTPPAPETPPRTQPDQNTNTARSPGRPRSNRIDSFNTDSFLRQNPKFIKFKKLLNIPEEKAWTIITSLFCYVAQFNALTPQITDPDTLAEFCYFDGNPNDLIQALTKAGFLNHNRELTSWFQNQSHAAKKLRNYEYAQSKKKH